MVGMAYNRDFEMSRSHLYCSQCNEEATVFALQPPLKVKACAQHAVALMQKHSSIFAIAAFDFIERPEDYPEYARRRDIVQKCRGCLTVLQERCESNRHEAHSGLQTAKEELQVVLERSIQELQIQVEQRFQRIKEELNCLSVHLEQFMVDKDFALPPSLEVMSQSIPAGALFRVCGGDCSSDVVKTVLGSLLLLPSGEGMPQIGTVDELLAKARTLQADLAEEVYDYALTLGSPNSDFQTAANKRRRQVAKELLLSLPWTATEPQVRAVMEQYLQRGKQAREEGDYAKCLKRLERGWDLLQQWGVESAELCLQLGVVWAHFGRKEAAVTVLKQGLQHSSDLSLHRVLVEVYRQTGEWKEAVEVGELALASVDSQFDSFELLQLLYFLAHSHYQLGNTSAALELVGHWTRNIAADTVQSRFALQCIEAEQRYMRGSKGQAVGLYEEALQPLAVQSTYLAVWSHFRLGWVNAA